MLKELLLKTRSYRRFDESRRISDEDLLSLAEAARLCPSAANLQRIKLAFVNESLQCEKVFKTLGFAAYLKDWDGPVSGERPSAYAVLMSRTAPDINIGIDAGLVAEAVLLSAQEKGIGGCIFRSFNPAELDLALGKEGYTPILVIALGYPAERVVLEDVKDGDIKYYRDADGVHHVPKYPVEEYII